MFLHFNDDYYINVEEISAVNRCEITDSAWNGRAEVHLPTGTWLVVDMAPAEFIDAFHKAKASGKEIIDFDLRAMMLHS